MIADTIAAISTAVGEGAIGVVRLSGPDAIAIAGCFFRAASGRNMQTQESHTARFGRVVDPHTGDETDQAVVTVFRAPHSYTGEDIVEISTHGGPVPLQRTLGFALRSGARPAEPGEFTKRAFLNGRMDLSQAEAVIDAIRALTDAALTVAVRQIEGVLSRRVAGVRDSLMSVITDIEASTDFPDDVPEPNRRETLLRVQHARDDIDRLLVTADSGRLYREGVACAIIGRPNVGKSSVLNALLRDARAIVTDVPGTTRDVLEESIALGGVAIRLMDTAGLRETTDKVESIGVQRARDAIAAADVLMVVLDASQPLSPEDEEALDSARGTPAVVILNKSDLPAFLTLADISVRLPSARIVTASIVTEEGIGDIETALAEVVLQGHMAPADVTVCRARHVHSLESARNAVLCAEDTLYSGRPMDLVSGDLQAAVSALGEISGHTVSDEIIDSIFSRFCVGK